MQFDVSLTHTYRTMYLSVPITFSVKVVGALTGIAVFAVYYNCDPLKRGRIAKLDHIIPHFVVTEMAAVPGILGLFTACIFSGVLRCDNVPHI